MNCGFLFPSSLLLNLICKFWSNYTCNHGHQCHGSSGFFLVFCFKLISNDCTGDIPNGFKKDKTLNKFENYFCTFSNPHRIKSIITEPKVNLGPKY